MRRHFSSISSILLRVSILCLNFAFTHAAVENEPSTAEVTTQAITTNDECLGHTQYCQENPTMNPIDWRTGNCFCCQGQYQIFTYISLVKYETCAPCNAGTYMHSKAHVSKTCNVCQVGKFQNSSKQSTCENCAAGTHNDMTKQSVCAQCQVGTFSAYAGLRVCDLCWAGKYNPDTGQSFCVNCAAGTFAENVPASMGATNSSVCGDCAAGTFSATTGARICTECATGKTSGAGASECTDCTEVLAQYAAYQRMPDHLQTCFRLCSGECLMTTALENLVCAAGKGWSRSTHSFTFSGNRAIETFTMTCSDCQPGYTSMMFKSYSGIVLEERINFICVLCTNGVHSTSPQDSAFVVAVKPSSNVDGVNSLEYFTHLYPESITCPCGVGKITDISGTCPPSLANTYQPVEGARTGINCPDLSSSPVGSSKLDDCECGEGLTKQYEYNLDDGTRANFGCYCDKGKYLNKTDTPYKCLKCAICDPETYPGHYKTGCEKESPGTCTPCQVCASASQKLAGCGLLSAGVCRDKRELVRTPWCPVADASKSPLAISARQASGLGSFTFEEVFGSDAQDADFVCSTPCDGVEYDSIQCDGPFACNVKTCAEKNVPGPGEYPKACPVVMEAKDVPQLRQDKRREKCVSCKECGHFDDFFEYGATWKNLHYEHWGGGCARECSKLLCADQQIWDWTQKKCSPCSELRDARLCSKRDWLALHLDTRSVTGNWALIQFPECQGEMAGKKLQSFEYGRCELCTANSECPLASEYPAMCVEGQVQCKACHRAGGGQAGRVHVFKDWWYNANSSAFEPLHCQISACIDSSMTGVRVQDVCTRACAVMVCQANEIQVPCRLPHDARCEAVFPNLQTFEYAGDEVNLLNEATDRHGRFASFENVLIVLQDPEDAYQCVWNADGIFDVKTSPAGVSSVFWLAGRSNDEDFAERGTRLCRIWEVQADTVMPLLPLQNTVCDENADASRIDALQARSRRMLVNTEAYVVSYQFGGAFADQLTANIHGPFTNSRHSAEDGMLQHAHVGGAGQLFLVLRMHESTAVVAVTVPSDRRLHEAMWVKTLLLSFAVVDVTQYCPTCEHAAISVSVTTTVDDKQISNLADNFVLESFWVQHMHTVALDDAADLGDDSSLFTLQVSDLLFKDWQRCNATDSQRLNVSMQVAPFKVDHTQANYSWLGQHEGSAVPFQVTMQCLKGTRLLADIECTNARDAAVVYVRRQPYPAVPHLLAAEREARGGTRDRTMLGLQHVHAATRALRADQHDSRAGLLRYALRPLQQPLRLLQAHALLAFDKHAVLLAAQNASHHLLLLLGADGEQLLLHTRVQSAEVLLGGFSYDIAGEQKIVLLIAESTPRTTSLRWYDFESNVTRLVIEQTQLSSGWVSVCARSSFVVALGVDGNNQLQVGFYTLNQTNLADQETLLLTQQTQHVRIEVSFDIVEEESAGNSSSSMSQTDPWLWHSRVAAGEDGDFLVAAVQQQQISADGETGGTRLLLIVCAGRQHALTTSCAQESLQVPADSTPAFVSLAHLRTSAEQVGHWVVAVHGIVFAVQTPQQQPVLVQLRRQSQLQAQHFVKVDPLFYTFGAVAAGASSVQVLSYLEGFERTLQSVPSVYAVVLVPASIEDGVVEDTGEYTPPQAALKLSIHRASYHVHTANTSALFNYERTGVVSGNESTQLLVSPHAFAPFTDRQESFFATYEGSGLNHRIGMPVAYGRYEHAGDTCRFTDRSLPEVCADCGVQLRKRARQASDPDCLVLKFEVPCGTLLPVVCARQENKNGTQSQPRCPTADVLIVLYLQDATTYYLSTEGTLKKERSPFADCVHMQAGVGWVNSEPLRYHPSDLQMLARLRRSAQLHTQTPMPVQHGIWLRERRVLSLNPVEHMRVEIHVERDRRHDIVSVGVDDVQLAPVLSLYPALDGPNVLCAPFEVPSTQELQMIDLDTLVARDHWERLHVTISLETAEACAYTATLYRGHAITCPIAPDTPQGLELVGCALSTSTHNVRGAYAECQLEVPMGIKDIGVVVRGQDNCQLSSNDSLVVWLRPYTALQSCPPGMFRDAQDICRNCHTSMDACDPGMRLSGCPALSDNAACVNCSEGADLVAAGKAHWESSNTSICTWACDEGWFRADGTCLQCREAPEPCPPGQRWQACEQLADAGCVPCVKTSDENEEYVRDFAYECQAACLPGFYNDTAKFAAGRCKRCWDRTEVVLDAARTQRFFALFDCTETRNARWDFCQEEPGAVVVGSDPAFEGRCKLQCKQGWRRRNDSETGYTCVECEHPLRVQDGAPTADRLESDAIQWQPESCEFACRPPWISTLRSAYATDVQDTCVLCENLDGSALCPIGQYPHGPYCECSECEL